MMTKVKKIHPDLNTVIQKQRIAAYCRVSTDSDEQLASLSAQKTHYEGYIKANSDWDFAGIYYDEGISGTKKENREGLLSLLRDCEDGKIDFIITKSISRFSRNTIDCLETVRRLIALGVYIYFEKENINTRSMDGELVLTILSSMAENESISISQNTKWSIARRFKNGTYKLACPPYGYDYIEGNLVVNEKEASIVKRIFNETLAGVGAQKIADVLNLEGIPSKKKSGWSASTIRGILSNERYTGDALLQKTYTDENFNRHTNYGEQNQYLIEEHHEAIICHDIFDSATLIMEQRGKEKGIEKRSSKYQNRYPFSGKIQCAECGSTFKRRIHGGRNKYIAWCCSKHIQDVSKCDMRFIRDEDLQKAFAVMMNKLIFGHKFVLKPLLDSLQSVGISGNDKDIKKLDENIQKNEDSMTVLKELMAKGYLELGLFKEQISELQKGALLLKQQKENLAQDIRSNTETISEVRALLKYVSKAEEIQSFDEELFRRFVNDIIVYSQEEIGFRMKCGLTLKERLVR